MTDLYRRATTEEARFIGRIASRETRIGLREGLLEEAIAAAFDAELGRGAAAHMLTGEIGETAMLAREAGSTRPRSTSGARSGSCSPRRSPTPPR